MSGRGWPLRNAALVLSLSLAIFSCSTHYVRRAPETERSAYLAHASIRPGMTVLDVVQVVVNLRRVGQYASVAFSGDCDPSADVILHGGELIAKVGASDVYAAGYASIQMYSGKEKSLSSHGFERQGPFLDAVAKQSADLARCRSALVSFSATAEGGCGAETIALSLDQSGKIASVGPAQASGCRQ